MKREIVCVLAIITVVACGKKSESVGCSDAAGTLAVVELIKSSAVESASKSITNVSQEKVKQIVSGFAVELSDARTNSKETGGTKSYCSAKAGVIIPQNVVDAVNKVLKDNGKSFTDLATEVGIQMVGGAHKGLTDIDYTIQPTDNSDSVYGSVSQNNHATDFIATLTAIMLRDEEQKAKDKEREAAESVAAANQAATAENEAATASAQQELARTEGMLQSKKLFDEAKLNIENANKLINAVWKNTSKDIREALLPEQREWLSKRAVSCLELAIQQQKDNQVLQEVARFDCEAKMTNERTEELKNKISELSKVSP